MAEPREIDDRLFAYAVGSLDAALRARLDTELAAYPAPRARLAWYEAVCESVIEAEAPLENPPSVETILERIRGKKHRQGFFGWLTVPALRPAALIAGALIVIQGVIIASLVGERAESERVRSVAPVGPPVTLVVAFDPNAREAAIRSLLIEAGATIVGGPKQLGEYQLLVPANRVDFAKSLFEHSKLVEYVRVEKP